MKLKEYVSKLEELLEKHGDVDVIYATDSEGNNFENVSYFPIACKFKEDEFGSFEIEFANSNPRVKVNAVCIN